MPSGVVHKIWALQKCIGGNPFCCGSVQFFPFYSFFFFTFFLLLLASFFFICRSNVIQAQTSARSNYIRWKSDIMVLPIDSEEFSTRRIRPIVPGDKSGDPRGDLQKWCQQKGDPLSKKEVGGRERRWYTLYKDRVDLKGEKCWL